MNCPKCGKPVDPGMKFCGNCGSAINAAPAGAAPQTTYYAGNGAVRMGIPAPGFSDRVNDPEIMKAVKKNRKAAGVFALFLVPLPIVGFVIYALASKKMEISSALLYGGIVSGVFLLFALWSLLKSRTEKSYEAVVTDKRTRSVYKNGNSDARRAVTEYTTVVRTTDGKKKKIVEHEGSLLYAFNYLEVGDRFRYHPQFNFPYEKYDKRTAAGIYCVSCGTNNPVEADRCSKCRLPLLK